jgi:UDP-N-acetylglucosamine 2-epimerase (non-hydrolysing)
MAPVAQGLLARGGWPTLVLTGQHPHLDPREFGLGDFDAVRLSCPGEADPHAHVRKVTQALLPLLGDPPDLLVVHGDTSSALGAALAGFMAKVPVGHVEAGLRTHDTLLPWPEEEYRVAIDAHAELLFAPTLQAAENLRAEQVPGAIHVTGKTSIDRLVGVEAELPPRIVRKGGRPRVLVTCYRRESWAEGLEQIVAALTELASDESADIELILHPNGHVESKMGRLLEHVSGISLISPSDYADLVRRIRDSDLVLSDSDGIQLVLQEKTERPGAVQSGNTLLVGTSADRIVAEARRLLKDAVARAAMSNNAYPSGDGRAGARIAAIIEDWLNKQEA